MARLAAETKTIRLGSGGIMLPNHSALKVAENFRLLECLYPGRIDLGIGRAPGGDRVTSELLNPSNTFSPADYIQQVGDLRHFLTDTPSEGTAYGRVRAIPRIETVPEIWMLTSSGESAYLAAEFGVALSYARFINPIGGREAVDIYRNRFKPSAQLASAKVNAGVFVFCSDDEKTLKEAQAVMDYRFLNFEKGRFDEAPTYEAASQYQYSPEEWKRVIFNRQRTIIGAPEEVFKKITAFAKELDIDEVMAATFSERKEDRFKSYEWLAKMFPATIQQQDGLKNVLTNA